MLSPEEALARLEADGLLRRGEGGLRTTARWQAAMTRAAIHLFTAGDPGADLRVPLAFALIELYGEQLTDEALVDLVAALIPLEAAELAPALAR